MVRLVNFGFASHWLKNWRESFKPIFKRSNRNHVITFDSHLKTALFYMDTIKMDLLVFKDDIWDPHFLRLHKNLSYSSIIWSFPLQEGVIPNLQANDANILLFTTP